MNEEKGEAFLLIHGFTGTHLEMKPLADFLKNIGYTVLNITLPGHETNPVDHAKTEYREILNYAQKKLDYLKNKYQHVYVGGLSMGGAITLYLGAKNPEIAGIICMATPYKIPAWRFKLLKLCPFLFFFMPWRYNNNDEIEDPEVRKNHQCYTKYRTKSVLWLDKLLQKVKESLPEVKVPTLLLNAKKDPSVTINHAEYILNKIKTEEKELHLIDKGKHLVPEDSGREQAFKTIKEWLEKS